MTSEFIIGLAIKLYFDCRFLNTLKHLNTCNERDLEMMKYYIGLQKAFEQELVRTHGFCFRS